MIIIDTLLIGLSSGAIYALMALALVLVWRSTRVVNFAQAGQAILSTYVGYEVMNRTHSYWVSIPFAIVGGAAIAAFIDAVIMRSLAKRSHKGSVSEIAPVIATLGLLGLIRSLTGMIWGNGYLQYNSPLSSRGFTIGNHVLPFSPVHLLIIVGTLVVMTIFGLIFGFTNLGLALRASAYQPEISRLAGIRVDRIRTIGWAFAGAAGGVAGALVTPTTFLSPNSLDLLLVTGFIAAVIGGLESLIGSVIGGLLLGVCFAFIARYIGSSVMFSAAFIILIAVLLLLPNGILGSKVGRRDA